MWKELFDFVFAICRHWGVVATGVGALVVTGIVEYLWPDHAPWWVWVTIVFTSVFIASFIAWRETKRDRDSLQKKLETLNTPSVTMELASIEEDLISKNGQPLFVKITNTSAQYIRPEVFAVGLVSVLKGHEYLYTHPGAPPSFGLNPGEHHSIDIVNYKKTYPQPFQLTIPTKQSADDTIRGKEFTCKLAAYGATTPSMLDFRFGVDDQTLWAQEAGSAVIRSHIRTLAGMASEALQKELKPEE